MNKKGFTLVEIIMVMVALGVIIVIFSTNGFGAFNKTKEQIGKVEEENLLEAARTFLVDVDNGTCSKSIKDAGNCNRDDYLSDKALEVKFFIENGYFKDDDKHCEGTKEILLKIKTDSDNNTIGYEAKKINDAEVICKK